MVKILINLQSTDKPLRINIKQQTITFFKIDDNLIPSLIS